ncbi:MAG: hypothetical protein HC837_01405 [Chloroflexaceae bacterium]|nr:hypothetical protein [Chloroflexaceae bacterium]
MRKTSDPAQPAAYSSLKSNGHGSPDQERVASKLQRLFLVDPTPGQMRSFSALSENLQRNAANSAGVLADLPIARKNAIEHQLAQYLTRLPEGEIKHIWTEKVGRLGTDAMLYGDEQWHPQQPLRTLDAR